MASFACGEKTYLPAGVFAFKLKILLSAWLYLWQPLAQEAPPGSELATFVEIVNAMGIYAARPPTTIDNYLSNFAQNTPLRIYRSKH